MSAKSIPRVPTKNLDTLQHFARLDAENKALRGRIILNDTLHQEREKELLKAISKANKLYKRESAKVESLKANKEVEHLRGIIKTQGIKILNQTKKINELMMEKL